MERPRSPGSGGAVSSQLAALDSASLIPPSKTTVPLSDSPTHESNNSNSNSLAVSSFLNVATPLALASAEFTPAVCPTPAAQVASGASAAGEATPEVVELSSLSFHASALQSSLAVDTDAASVSSAGTHAGASRAPRTRGNTSVAASEPQSSLAPVLSEASLALLRLSCGAHAPVTSFLASSAAPQFLCDAIRRVLSSSKKQNEATTKQRFFLAVAFALQIHHEPDQTLLAHPEELLIAEDSEGSIELGRGFLTSSIAPQCAVFGFPATSHRSVRTAELIDAACRTLLRGMKKFATATPMLERIHDDSLPLESSARFDNMRPFSGEIVQRPLPPVAESLLSADLQGPPGRLKDIALTPISGEGNQCWYRATGKALGIQIAEITEMLRSTLATIDDAPTLCRYGILDDPMATEESIAACKNAYLSSSDFVARANGGSVEMYLLSHAQHWRSQLPCR